MMPGYDVTNGLSSATLTVWLIGFVIVVLIGAWIGRKKR